MSQEKISYSCGNCPFWEYDPSLTPAARIVTSDNAPQKRVGQCRLNPPVTIPVQAPHPMTGETRLRAERVPLPMFDHECCGQHPEVKHALSLKIAHSVIALWKNWLEYAPGKFPDETAAGFSRIPAVQELTRFVPKEGQVQGDGGKQP